MSLTTSTFVGSLKGQAAESSTAADASGSSQQQDDDLSIEHVVKRGKVITGGKDTRHPVYRGVRRRPWGIWVTEIRRPKKKTRIWLGSFASAEMAARAYDAAALALRGPGAILNFPKSASSLPRPADLSDKSIQAAATAAANISPSAADHEAAAISMITDDDDHHHHVDDAVDEDLNIFQIPNVLSNMYNTMGLSPPFMQQQQGINNIVDPDCSNTRDQSSDDDDSTSYGNSQLWTF
ncbi:unnamed protein product [Sphagnum troendelagicum]|uniref:AP2/ERF domain-containing protein n=1 Tax=Sphagnum troendelagicum TaxID=128251 RepID=A0ABP0V3M9_9BRYO